MQMPVPAGAPVPLPAAVAGSLSRMQGLLQAAQPEIQNAYARHWEALRDVGAVPAFQQLTQNMLWVAYATETLGGLLRRALSGQGTAQVLAGIIDQLNLLQYAHGQTVASLGAFLQTPGLREVPSIQPLVQSLQPLDRVYRTLGQPLETVLTTLPWMYGAPLPMIPIRQAQFTPQPGSETGQAAP